MSDPSDNLNASRTQRAFGTFVRINVDCVGGRWYKWEQVFDRTSVRNGHQFPEVEETDMSSTTMSRAAMGPGLAPVIQLPARPGVGSGVAEQLRQWGGEISNVEVATGPWRLTLRGRVAVVVAAVLAVLAVLSVIQVATAGESTSANQVVLVAAQQQSDTVVVKAGDTLWSIATREMPNRDPREAVVALREANGITGGEITAGQRLHLPTRH